MAKQRVEIKLTPVTTTVGRYTAKTYEQGWCGEVTGADAIRNQIDVQVKEVIRKFTRHLESRLTAEVTLEGGTSLIIPIAVSLRGTYYPAITDDSIKVATGKEVTVKFGGQLHNTLYRLTQNRQLGHAKSIISLQALDLINTWNNGITKKGHGVLKRLKELGPPTDKRGLLLVARELFNVDYGVNVVTRDYLVEGTFITFDSKRARYVLTAKGVRWLERYAFRLYNYKLPASISRVALVPYLSREQLAGPLTHKLDLIRIKARQRMEELDEVAPSSAYIVNLQKIRDGLDINEPTIQELWKEIMGEEEESEG